MDSSFVTVGGRYDWHSAKSGRHFYYLCSKNFKQGKDSCDAFMLPRKELERLVINEVRSCVLTDENLEELIVLANEELQSTSIRLKDKLDAIDTELRDVSSRLSRLYDTLETGRLEIDDLAPRIRELKAR